MSSDVRPPVPDGGSGADEHESDGTAGHGSASLAESDGMQAADLWVVDNVLYPPDPNRNRARLVFAVVV